MTIQGGKLTFDVVIPQQAQILNQINQFGKVLSQALNAGNSGRAVQNALNQVGNSATQNANRITRFVDSFNQLQGQFRAGTLNAQQYASRLNILQAGLQRATQYTNLSSKEWSQLGLTMQRVQRAQQSLDTSSQNIVNRTRALVNELKILRAGWQETGVASDAVKNRIRQLHQEMQQLTQAIQASANGAQTHGRSLVQLANGQRLATGTLEEMAGGMKRYGIAAQTSLGVQYALANQFYRFGPLGYAMGSSLGVLGTQMGSLSASTLAVGGAVAGLGATLVGLTRRGLPEFRELQTAFRIMVADGAEFTQSDLVGYLDDIRESAGKAGQLFARAEMATALSELVKAGLDASEAMELLAPGMRLAAITGDTLNDSTTRLLGNIRQFRLPVTEAVRVVDALAAADLNAAETAKELSEGLAVVGPVARAAGFELEDTLGILIELNNAGLGAADIAATALRSNLSQLLSPTAEARRVIASLGVQLEDSSGKMRPLLYVLQELVKAMDEGGEAARNAADIFDTRALVAVLNMTEKSTALADALRNSAGQAERFVDILSEDNYDFALRSLDTAISNLSFSFVSMFAPALTTIINKIAEFITSLDDLKNATEPFARSRFFANLFFPNMSVEELMKMVDLDTGPQQSGGRSNDPRDRATISKIELPVEFQVEVDSGPVEESMDSLIARAQRLKTALDAAVKSNDPQAWLTAQQAVDDFRNSSERAGRAWEAVVATAGRSNQTIKTVATVIDDLNTKMKNLETANRLAGNTTESRVTMLKDQIRSIGVAVDQMIELGLDETSELLQKYVEEQQGLMSQLLRLEDPAHDARIWTNRLREELRRGIKDAEDVFELLRPVLIRLEDQASAVLAEFGFDSEEYQKLVTQIQLIGTLLNEVDEAGGAAMRAPFRRAEALDKAIREEQAEVERLKEEARQNAVIINNQTARVSTIIAQGIHSGNRELIEAALSAISTFRTRFGDRVAEQFNQLEITLKHQLGVLEGALKQLVENPIRTAQMIDAEVLGPGAGMRTGQEYESPSQRRARMDAVLKSTLEEMNNGIRVAEQMGEAFGETFDVTAEKARVTERAIQTLINNGFKAGDVAVVVLLKSLGLLNEELEETLKKRTAFEDALALDEWIAEQFESDMEVLRAAQYHAEVLRRHTERVSNQARTALLSGNAQLIESALEAIETFRDRFGTKASEVFDNYEQMLATRLANIQNALHLEMLDAEVAGPGAGMSTGMTPDELKKALQAAAPTVEKLREQLLQLRLYGIDPASEAIQTLVRRIREMELRDALKEWKDKGINNISEFARSVLILNGVILEGTKHADTFKDALMSLGDNSIAQGLVKIIDGIQGIKGAAGDAEKTVQALTLILQGATDIVSSFEGGDTFGIAKNLTSIAGEAIGQAVGIPGVGQLVSAAFDFGKALVQSISDWFTGDNPAARAIRESLTSAVQGAFSTGIMAALRGEANWKESLEDSVKVAFLSALIESFVKSAIVGAYLEPLFMEYSKMISRGQYAAAAEYLSTHLPWAIQQSIAAAETIAGLIPPGLLPTQSGKDVMPGPESPQWGITDLPSALVERVSAPAWMSEIGLSGNIFKSAATTFNEAVERLISEGIKIAGPDTAFIEDLG